MSNFIKDSIEALRKRPKWTVLTNLVSPESNVWVGMSWEFFDEEHHAEACYKRHLEAGNVPTKRYFFPKTDIPHLGMAHRKEIGEAVVMSVNAVAQPEIRQQLAEMLVPEYLMHLVAKG